MFLYALNQDFLKFPSRFIKGFFEDQGLSQSWAMLLNVLILCIVGAILVALLDFVIWKVFRFVSYRLAQRSKTNFDNFAVANRLPRFLAHILPLILAMDLTPFIFSDYPVFNGFAIKVLKVLGVILALKVASSILRTISDFLKTRVRYRDKPIDSYIQVFMIFAWLTGIFTILAIITEINFWKFITGLGTASAVLLLVFRDTILGFVASLQVSINDMVRIGDWITFDKYGADGDVTEINLATVKVQNFDKTITTIPTYALISDSFKNWRGMQNSDGRRIKRAVSLKEASIRFLTEQEIQKFHEVQLLQDYLKNRIPKINDYNQKNGIDKSLLMNGRNLTNLGLLRKYMEKYLENHSAINENMTLMVRQLAPTPYGVALEIYAFSKDKVWQNYEYIIADIFDHLLAAIPFFDLEIYELGALMSEGETKD